LKTKGYLTEVFTFIDATALTSKLSMWEEKDKSIQDGYEKLNNVNLPKYAKDMVILKNNMKDKNKDKDRWISGLRAPYEVTFSKQNKRTRYMGQVKNQAAEFLYAIAFNFRRLLVIET